MARLLRVLRGIAGAVAVLLLFVLSLVAGALLHLDLPSARRFATQELNLVLAGQFQGVTAIDRLGHLSILGVRGVDATVKSADGEDVIVVKGAAATIEPLRVLAGSLLGHGDRRIEVARVAIDAVDVDLDAAADGTLKLVRAFDSRTPPIPPAPGDRGVAIALPDVRVAHVWAHGTMSGAPPIDADLDALRAGFLTDSTQTKLDVPRVALLARGLPRGITVRANVSGHIAIPAGAGPSLFQGRVAANVGAVPLTVEGALVGDSLDAVVDVPEVAPEDVRASVEGAPVYAPVSAHVEAHGELADLRLTAHVGLGAGTVDVRGDGAATGPLVVHASVVARGLDARAVAESAPETDLGFSLAGSAETKPDGTLEGGVALDVPVGSVAGQTVPHAVIHAAVAREASKEGVPPTLTAHATGVVDEPGAPLALTVDGRSRSGATWVSWGVKVDSPRLDEVRRVKGLGAGAADVIAKGHAEITSATELDAEVEAHVRGYVRDQVSVGDAALVASAHGTPARPVVEAALVAHGVAGFGQKLTSLEVDVHGAYPHAHVAVVAKGAPSVKLGGDLTVGSGQVVARGVTLDVKRDTKSIEATVDSLEVGGGLIEAKGISLTGAGEPLKASFASRPGALAVRAKSAGLSVATLGYLAGRGDDVRGRLALDVDLDAKGERARGKASIDLDKGAFGRVHDLDAHVALDVDGRHLSGDVRAAAPEVGSINLSGLDVHAAGGPLGAASWRAAWGKVSVAADADLARLANLLPPGAVPVADLSGHFSVTGSVARDSMSDLTPEIHLFLRSSGLSAAGQAAPPVRLPGGPLMVGPPTWVLTGLDIDADVLVDGEDSAAELAVRIVDPLGPLASVDVKTAPLPFDRILRGGQAPSEHGDLDGGPSADLTHTLETLPIAVRVDVPRRALDKLPLVLRPPGMAGFAEGSFTLEGTALEPKLAVAVRTHDIRLAVAPKLPVDGTIAADYDGAVAHVKATMKGAEATVFDGVVDLRAKVADLLARGAGAPWGASAKVSLAGFPLASIPALGNAQVSGTVSGDVTVTGLHEHAAARAELALDDLHLGQAHFTKGNVKASLDDHGLDADVKLDNALDATARMGMAWGADLAPRPDGAGLEATLHAARFPAAAAEPFAAGSVANLAGWVDADAKVAWKQGGAPSMSGSVALSDVAVDVPGLVDLHAVKARLTLTPDGKLKLEDVEAHGTSGKLTASGTADLAGGSLESADLALDIRKGEGIPLDIQGSSIGSIYGHVGVKASAPPNGPVAVSVDVPHLRVDLPAGSLPRATQALDDAPRVHIGVFRDADRFVLLPGDAAPAALIAARTLEPEPPLPGPGAAGSPPPTPRHEHPMDVSAQAEGATKGDKAASKLDVKIHVADTEIVRGQQLDVRLGGDLKAVVGATTEVRGQIKLTSGKLNVQGKEFTIEKGTVTFVGPDPGDPQVNVTAGWTAPDGTQVFADYVGPVNTGKVTLRSEPPRPKNEIVSLIAFGTADGSAATPYASRSPSTGVQAGSAIGGLSSDGLSKGLDQLTGLNVTAKVDTSDSANPRPEVELQIAKDISLELAFVLGTPPPGENPDTTYATVAWRFVRNWSLETTFGDYGSTFADLVWQHRY